MLADCIETEQALLWPNYTGWPLILLESFSFHSLRLLLLQKEKLPKLTNASI